MNQYLAKGLALLQSVPRKVLLWILVAGTVAVIVLEYLAKSTTLKAKDMNLNALINDAVTNLQLKMNKDKISELEVPPKKEDLPTDPKEVEEFYKNRK